MLLEYDPSTLAPLGLVVGKDELAGRQIAIIDRYYPYPILTAHCVFLFYPWRLLLL